MSNEYLDIEFPYQVDEETPKKPYKLGDKLLDVFVVGFTSGCLFASVVLAVVLLVMYGGN